MVRPDDTALTQAAAVLDAATNVTILAGAGVAGSHAALIQLAETLQAPIVHALRGKEFVEYDNPYDVGMTGLLGFASGYKAIKEADVLLMLGTDFPYPQFYPEGATVIQVDIRGRHIGRRTPVDVALVGDVGDTLAALQPMVTRKSDGAHLQRCLHHYTKTRKSLTPWRSTTATRPRSGRNTLPHLPAGWRPRTRCSPWTWVRRWCGRPATCR